MMAISPDPEPELLTPSIQGQPASAGAPAIRRPAERPRMGSGASHLNGGPECDPDVKTVGPCSVHLQGHWLLLTGLSDTYIGRSPFRDPVSAPEKLSTHWSSPSGPSQEIRSFAFHTMRWSGSSAGTEELDLSCAIITWRGCSRSWSCSPAPTRWRSPGRTVIAPRY